MARYETALIVTVSKLYYLKQLKQEEIAKRLKISRALVSLILNEAKRLGVVEFRINDPQGVNESLSDALKQFFPSVEFVVVPTSSKDELVLREFIASRSVEVINNQMVNGETIGISWGRTSYSIMSSFTANSVQNLSHVVPLVGGSNKNIPRFQLNELVRVFASSMDAEPHLIHAPAMPESQEDYELYIQSHSMKEICKRWKKIDFAIIPIGAPPVKEEFDGSPVLLSHKEKWLSSENNYDLPVGNMCARYFDIHGRFVEDEIQKRIIAIPFELMKQIPKVIGISAGISKAFSVVGALKTGIIKTLVIDEMSATAVVELLGREKTEDLNNEILKIFGICKKSSKMDTGALTGDQ